MKAHAIIALFILSLIYLTPDFNRIMGIILFPGHNSSCFIQKASEIPDSNKKSATFQRRRFVPPSKTNEIVKIYSIIIPNSIYQPLTNDFTALIPEIKISYKATPLGFSCNKAPPFISC